MSKHKATHNTIAFPIGKEPPIVGIICDAAGDPPGLTYFSVIFSDAPYYASDLTDDDERRGEPICGHCLIDDYPEAGRGLDLAMQHGSAELDPVTGEWTTETNLG